MAVSNQKKTENTVLSKYIAGENISALKAVYLQGDEEARLGDPSEFSKSIIVGVSLNAAAFLQKIEVQSFGVLKDPSFSFTNGELLFLNSLGTITAIQPSSGHRTKIGHGLGAGAIFIDLQEPIVLT